MLFPGLKRVIPEWEMHVTAGMDSASCKEIAPDHAAVIAQKDRVPYFIAGTLKEAELNKGRLRATRRKAEAPSASSGQQRTSHRSGQLFILDDDRDVFARDIKAEGAWLVRRNLQLILVWVRERRCDRTTLGVCAVAEQSA